MSAARDEAVMRCYRSRRCRIRSALIAYGKETTFMVMICVLVVVVVCVACAKNSRFVAKNAVRGATSSRSCIHTHTHAALVNLNSPKTKRRDKCRRRSPNRICRSMTMTLELHSRASDLTQIGICSKDRNHFDCCCRCCFCIDWRTGDFGDAHRDQANRGAKAVQLLTRSLACIQMRQEWRQLQQRASAANFVRCAHAFSHISSRLPPAAVSLHRVVRHNLPRSDVNAACVCARNLLELLVGAIQFG